MHTCAHRLAICADLDEYALDKIYHLVWAQENSFVVGLRIKQDSMLCRQLGLGEVNSVTLSDAEIVYDSSHQLLSFAIKEADHVEELLAEGHVCPEIAICSNDQ